MLPGCVPWPDSLADRYRRDGYWTPELLGSLLDRAVETDGGRRALVSPKGSTTYSALDARASRLASGFQRLAIHPGDRVVVQLPNGEDFVAVTLALFRIGALPVFALPAHRRHEIGYLCRHAETVAYVMPGEHLGFDFRTIADELAGHLPHLRHLISSAPIPNGLSLAAVEDDRPSSTPQIDPADVAFFLLSGGTTGTPKLIPRTHQDYAYQLRATAAAVGVDEHTVYLAALPAAHNAALGCPGVLGTLRAGGTVVLAETPSPADLFPIIARERVTLTTLMPSILKLWIEVAEFLPADLSSVLFQVGGAWLDPQVARKVYTQLGARLTHWFGMAEGFLSHTRLDDPIDVAAETTGRPLSPGDEVRIVDEDGTEVAAGATGELQVRGPYTLRGYYKADDYNAATFTADGFLRTGDFVRRTTRGDIIVEGRRTDLINRGGEKVPAEELEQQLRLHPNIVDAAVVPVPDPAMIEKTCAFVVARSRPPEPGELRQFLRQAGLAEFKLPDRIEIVASLPYTSLGKVNKRVLRERFEEKKA